MLGQDRFEYQLEKPVTYHHKGEKCEGQLLVLIAPTARQNGLRQKMQQMFMQSIASLRNKRKGKEGAENTSESDEDSKMGSSEVLSIIMMSDIDMGEFNEMVKRLLFDGACLVEGDEKLTPKIYDEFSAYDCDKLMGEYVAFFIAALALRLMNGK